MPKIIKIMSLTPKEFRALLARLISLAADSDTENRYKFSVAGGAVEIEVQALAPVTHGGLLTLPRSRVTLEFYGLSDAQTNEFLAKFDRTFRRGGG